MSHNGREGSNEGHRDSDANNGDRVDSEDCTKMHNLLVEGVKGQQRNEVEQIRRFQTLYSELKAIVEV